MTTISAWIGTDYLGAGGTQIDATVGDWVRRLDIVDAGAIPYQQSVAPHIQPVGDQKKANSRPESLGMELVVTSTTTATMMPVTSVRLISGCAGRVAVRPM